jgi:tetratricopeptide (TPR) repeat protein
MVRAEHAAALKVADELVRQAKEARDGVLLLPALLTRGTSLLHMGDLAEALASLRQASERLDDWQLLPTLMTRFERVDTLAFGGLALWLMGQPEQALESSRTAVALAREQGYVPVLTLIHYLTGILHQLRGEVAEVHASAEAALALAAEHRFPLWQAGARVLRGWALSVQGEPAEGLAQLRDGLAGWRATEAVIHRPYHLALLAGVLAGQGQAEEARQTVEEALALVGRMGETFYEAELYRLRGELASSPEQAEEAFRRALDVAGRQGARSLELRAAESLARLTRSG